MSSQIYFGTSLFEKSHGAPLLSLQPNKTNSLAATMPSSKETTCFDGENARKAIAAIPSFPFESSLKIPLSLTVALTSMMMAWPSFTAVWSPERMWPVKTSPFAFFQAIDPSLYALKSHSPRAKLLLTSMPRHVPISGAPQVATLIPVLEMMEEILLVDFCSQTLHSSH